MRNCESGNLLRSSLLDRHGWCDSQIASPHLQAIPSLKSTKRLLRATFEAIRMIPSNDFIKKAVKETRCVVDTSSLSGILR